MCFHISCFPALSCCAAWTWKIQSDWISKHQIFYLVLGVLKLSFHYWACKYLTTFFSLQESATSSWLIRHSSLSGQRQSWQRERATLDQQMYTYICHVKMSNIVLAIFSHLKTNPTSSHPLGQIEPVCKKIYIFGQVLVSHGAGTHCNERPLKWSLGEDDIQTKGDRKKHFLFNWPVQIIQLYTGECPSNFIDCSSLTS